ncbi:MAG: multidrug efflux pump [Flavobacteriales bacterium]|jgi:multidrug efflux pump
MDNPIKKVREASKSFKLTNLALNNSTSVFILLTMIVFLGLGAYNGMPKELFPEIKMPTVYVSTAYPGNAPLDIENLITRPLEKEIQTIKGIKNLKSTSIQDFSAVIVEFNPNEDIDKALLEVKDAIDRAKNELPNDLPDDPSAKEIDMSEMPILNINLSGDFSIDNLKDYAEKLEDEIESLPEINKVDIKGVLDREVEINVNLFKMESNEISFNDIQNAIVNENVSMAAGEVQLGNTKRTIRVVGEFERPEDMGDVIIKHEKGNFVYLRDIATVVDGYKERESYARLDGKPVVSLDVIKKSGENLLEATRGINLILEEARASYLPNSLKITITNDQSQQTKDQLKNLENSIISGVILVILVLLFFLGLRNAIFVGMAIPMSMFLSFFVLSAMGVSMNMIVLFALILALGMLVDNAIVVIENIYRLYEEEGLSAYEAAKQGVGEVAIPIIASTATTLAAFFPLLFWNDLMGEFMKYIPLTLIIVLSSSLIIALVINPVVAMVFIKRKSEEKALNKSKRLKYSFLFISVSAILYALGNIPFGTLFLLMGGLGLLDMFLFRPGSNWFQKIGLVWLEAKYLKIVRKVLKGKGPLKVMLATFAMLIGSIAFFVIASPNVEFFPVNEPKYINIFVEMPVGSDIAYTDSLTKIIEKRVEEIIAPDKDIIESVIANVGAGTSDPGEGPSMGNTPHKARITVSFLEYEFRKGRSTSEVMKRISELMQPIPGVKLSVEKNQEGPPQGKAINIEVVGEDFDKLLVVAENMQRNIEKNNIRGVEGLKFDLELGKPELILHINRAKARMFGLNTMQIGSTVRTALFGREISKFKDGEDEYPIQLRLEKDARNDVSTLMNQRITFRDPATGKISQVPVSSVASYSYNTTYGSVKRKDLDRVITIYSNVLEGFNATAINNELKEVLSGMEMPEGYEYKFTGQQEEQASTQAFLIKALLIAIALIALILVSQFNSIVKPFIIILSVVFSTIGVFFGLALFQMDFVVIMTGIGIVSLAGIVVNNAIVLIDYIELIKIRKRKELGLEPKALLPAHEAVEAIVEGGKTRLRPVLLTAITTVLGLVPMATGMNIDFGGLITDLDANIYFGGDNAAFWGPMAWTVIFGLTFATFLTLVVVPAMYLITEKLKSKSAAFKAKRS